MPPIRKPRATFWHCECQENMTLEITMLDASTMLPLHWAGGAIPARNCAGLCSVFFANTLRILGIVARVRIHAAFLALQLPFMKISESMGNHVSKIVDAGSVG
jgi:hypothetical protein